MIEALAVDVLLGDGPILDTWGGLATIGRRPVPVAVHYALGEAMGVVLFLIHRSDNFWQAELAMASGDTQRGWDVVAISGGICPDPMTWTSRGDQAPDVFLEGRVQVDDHRELVAVGGHSVSKSVLATSGGGDAGRALVLPHHLFVLSAVIQASSELSVH